MSVPTDRSYTAEHEWVLVDGSVATVGITEFAAEALGDVVFVQLPDVGAQLTAGEACGEIESTKSVSDLFAPVTGSVIEVNSAIDAGPETVNSDPYGAGWLFRVEIATAGELLDAAAYAALTSGE
ncbi:glycine cleavage system H protein [Beutenbergia cavernae DSM 12333]|uniref:Glycine cleavage system H protein n=1 Tax=Beutenbergia cavernae (strain ATCC BAA-8 / DSM 12333 / CCUG 43141 / JCM 11478 / NBRC 16432 / NCIMB 13614 / HKI 0122) TaxID=471853 RepID=GCSH_BEUC1|nr:glycine cleavage system protein GcvH [Beutenbergia cavernae]C5C5I0.1 RecName: Full=Glycine cleavage system H protein [Beutenbergia cavernae DSM 12333]ACQ80171.1 glycine cleavage system H protein [Beutenbergia cavernae DSM 12333]